MAHRLLNQCRCSRNSPACSSSSRVSRRASSFTRSRWAPSSVARFSSSSIRDGSVRRCSSPASAWCSSRVPNCSMRCVRTLQPFAKAHGRYPPVTTVVPRFARVVVAVRVTVARESATTGRRFAGVNRRLSDASDRIAADTSRKFSSETGIYDITSQSADDPLETLRLPLGFSRPLNHCHATFCCKRAAGRTCGT